MERHSARNKGVKISITIFTKFYKFYNYKVAFRVMVVDIRRGKKMGEISKKAKGEFDEDQGVDVTGEDVMRVEERELE